MNDSVLSLINGLCQVKRGLADLEQDCDKAIKAMKLLIDEIQLNDLTLFEVSAITYNLVFLCHNDEYSIREYAIHGLNTIFEHFKSQREANDIQGLINQIEH